MGNLIVAETGTGNNDGRVILIDAAGQKFTLVHSLPSYLDTATHEVSGPWRPYIAPDSSLWVIVGSGTDSSAGSIMQFSLAGVHPGSDSLTVADTTRIIHIQSWALSNGFMDSNVFSATWDANGNIYAADAGANAVLKIDPAGTISTLDTFPAIPNTFTPFPPFIDYVPTKIISGMNNDLYLCNLTGFPFLRRLSQIVKMDLSGNISIQQQNLTQAVDMDMDSAGNIFVLQFGLYDSNFLPKVSIGINSGEVISGNIGSSSLRRLDYTVIGDVVNTAQRLQSTSREGQIIINQTSYEKVKESFNCKAIGEMVLKNKAKPMMLFEVLD